MIKVNVKYGSTPNVDITDEGCFCPNEILLKHQGFGLNNIEVITD
jgi:hypothetical protein